MMDEMLAFLGLTSKDFSKLSFTGGVPPINPKHHTVKGKRHLSQKHRSNRRKARRARK